MNGTLVILIIDDDKGDRKFCRRALKSEFGDSLRLLEAEDGETGLELIENRIPDCVLLDHFLPGIDGIEVLKKIRTKYPYLPVVIINGNGNDSIVLQSMKEGAQDYIAKNNMTPRILQRIIEMAIHHCITQKRTQDQRISMEIFTRALAHDLKEPARTISSFLDIISDWRNLSGKSQKSFNYARKAAQRMNALIDAVYLYTRLDAAEQMEISACGVAEVLDEVRENLARLIEERGATLIYHTLPYVFANRVQMVQLFQNLVTNAIRHCDEAVTIRIDCEEQKDHWLLAVRDNGPGIASEDFAKIFDPFKRLSRRKEDEPGLGLGLATNRKIVDSYGGKIWCESTLGAGTTFLLTLPKAVAIGAADGARSSSVAPADKADGRARSLGRILMVDDSEADLELNRIFLVDDVELRCDVLTAGDGEEALVALRRATAENNPIDLIVLDINMPVMSGFELLEHMKQSAGKLHPLVVMCSTSISDIDKRTATSLGVVGYLTKPPLFSSLKDIIDSCPTLQLRREGSDFVLRRVAEAA